MTIDEAIEILRNLSDDEVDPWEPDQINAFHLGIEALTRERDNRSGSKYVIVAPLKGETEE